MRLKSPLLLGRWLFAIFLSVLLTVQVQAQRQQFELACIAFYNVENLFDTINEPGKMDLDYTPEGSYLWDTEKYQDKLTKLADVIAVLGTEMTPHGASVIGFAEVENRRVLEDLAAQPQLADRNYGIVHYESPDFRGIDNALFYNPAHFEYLSSRALPFNMEREDGSMERTREVLLVTGKLHGELIHIMVNHWPSRRGGEEATRHKRIHGAKVNRAIVDSLKSIDPMTKIVIMGDFNDDPVNQSMTKYLKATGSVAKMQEENMYNPFYEAFKKGLGTNAWRDSWSLFDQIIVSYGLAKERGEGWRYYKAEIYNDRKMVQRTGRYAGYPFRSFVGGQYVGGYSDHFPVFIYLVRPTQ
nr:endonuclease/exonuclease/phosphatase family protein [Saprospiraceae bacterium]